MRVGTIIVFTEDVSRLRAFYTSVLGLEVLETREGWVRLDAGGCALALHAIRGPRAGGEALGPRRADGQLKVAFHAADVAAERARLVAAGARMDEVKTFEEISLCDGLDPDGNVFQISSRR
jgi:catechol 2,3-dioxygenase-like lactoylglutathione lyase family enzyme